MNQATTGPTGAALKGRTRSWAARPDESGNYRPRQHDPERLGGEGEDSHQPVRSVRSQTGLERRAGYFWRWSDIDGAKAMMEGESHAMLRYATKGGRWQIVTRTG